MTTDNVELFLEYLFTFSVCDMEMFVISIIVLATDDFWDGW